MARRNCVVCWKLLYSLKEWRDAASLWTPLSNAWESFVPVPHEGADLLRKEDAVCNNCCAAIRMRHKRNTVVNLRAIFDAYQMKRTKAPPPRQPASADVGVDMDVESSESTSSASGIDPHAGSQDHPSSSEQQSSSQFSSSNVDIDMDIESSDSSAVPQIDSQTARQGLKRRRTESVLVPGINSIKPSENKCFVCQAPTRTRISADVIWDVYKSTNVLIPMNNRCCRSHIENGALKDPLTPTQTDARLTGTEVASLLKKLREILNRKDSPISFSNDSLPDFAYEMLLGVSKGDFETLHGFVDKKLRKSSSRDSRNALAMLLTKLRLNLSQRVIGFLFGVTSQSTVSRAINAVLEALEGEFVPQNIGFSHISRQDLFEKHMRKFFSAVLGRDEKDLILILDATYLYVQKSTDLGVQWMSFSMHKLRNLFKPMMVVCPDGYIWEAKGLFFADHGNNDAKILQAMMTGNAGDLIIDFLEERDVMILDRGFRDAIADVENAGVDAFMPQLLQKGQKQFTTLEANMSRQVTLLRWIVESANGRLKHIFRFFDDIIPASYFKKLDRLFRLACAIVNRFCGPLFVETAWHEDVVPRILERLEMDNHVQTRVEEGALHTRSATWIPANQDDLLEFPLLSLEELKLLTLGSYQLKVGLLYNQHHLRDGGGYTFEVHRDAGDLVRVRLQSRFRRRQSHLVWIEFDEHAEGVDSITGWFCRCKTGARTLGCCGHVAAILRHLSHDRFEPPRMKEDISSTFLNAAALLAEDGDSDESDTESADEDEEMARMTATTNGQHRRRNQGVVYLVNG